MFFLFENCPNVFDLVIKYNKYQKLYEDESDIYYIECLEDYKEYNYTFIISYKRKENLIEYETNGESYCFNINETFDHFPINKTSYGKMDVFPKFLKHQYDDYCENIIIQIKKIDKDNIFIKENRNGMNMTYYCSKSY